MAGTVRMGVAERRAEQGNLDGSAEEAAPEGDYDDPTAVLTGSWGPNQYVRATVFSRNQTEDYFQEVEIRLRSAIAPHSCTGYEVFWRCLKTENAYAEIVRWNGADRRPSSRSPAPGATFGVSDGDVVEATIVGNRITGFINGVEVISATDDTYRRRGPWDRLQLRVRRHVCRPRLHVVRGGHLRGVIGLLDAGDVLARFADDADGRQDRGLGPVRDDDSQQDASRGRLKLEADLLGLNRHQRLSLCDRVALGLEPLGHGSGVEVLTGLWHDDPGCHRYSSALTMNPASVSSVAQVT